MEIRDARDDDLSGILAIRNDVVVTSTAIWYDEPGTLDELRSWFEQRAAQSFPVIVAADDTGVVGFGSFSAFRNPPGYRRTVEHSVHVRADSRGRGIGRALVEELIVRARELGNHVLVAGVDGENAASLRLHESLGFERVAHFREVGRKFDRWLDLVFLQKTL